MLNAIQLLMRLGITANYNGYWYLLAALDMVDLNSLHSIRVTKNLYPNIAEKYNTTIQNVERGIRTVIAVCWDFGNRDLLCSICSCSQKPTNATFIASLAAHLYLNSDASESISAKAKK